MPEATVNEYGELLFGEHDVGFSGEVIVVDSIAKIIMPEGFSEDEFWLRIIGPDPRHDPASFLFGYGVHDNYIISDFLQTYTPYGMGGIEQ